MNVLKILAIGYAVEAKRLRRLETKTKESEVTNFTGYRELFAKYGTALTIVQFNRLARRRRHVLSVTHRVSLHKTRTHTLRKASRHTGLARAYFAGKKYAEVESFCYESPNWEKVQELVRNNIYDGKDSRLVMQGFSEWLADAKDHLLKNGVLKNDESSQA